MGGKLFHFFKHPEFDKCFFTGAPVKAEERISVFPDWILDRYDLREQWLGMLNWNRVKYGELYVPCSSKARERVDELESTVQNAFEAGYRKVEELNDDLIFLWMSKIILGILFHDISYSIDLSAKRNKKYTLSPLLTQKYSNLHYQLQSLVSPVRWTVKPYSLVKAKLNYSKDIFNFRDETNNLNFSLGMNGFGLVACLQDFEVNRAYHQTIVEQIVGVELHAIQFEELCARFIYSNYLLNEHSGWKLTDVGGEIVMVPADTQKPDFKPWDDTMYASVLPTYWAPWNIDPKEIYTFPDSPLSFLIDETTNELIHPDKIELPS